MPFPDFEPTLPVFLETRTAEFGERPLILLDDERLTYAEAATRSEKLTRGLLASGIVKGTRVGLLMPNGPDWVVAWLAAFLAAAELCVTPADPSAPAFGMRTHC